MKKDIYNKNAREAHLMAEAYTNIYKEEFNPRSIIGAEVTV